MLKVNTIFNQEGIIAKTFFANYEEPYTERDYNVFPSVSFAVGSCFKYKSFNQEYLIRSNEVLIERGDIEYELTKLHMWKQDTTLSLLFIDEDQEIAKALAGIKYPVSIQKRTLQSDFISRMILQNQQLSSLRTEQLIVELVSHLVVESKDRKEECKINFYSIKQVEEAKDFIYANYMRKIQIADIAFAVYISLFHFCRLFKKITGVSPYHFLLQVRLEKAKILLQQGESVTQAAMSSGFDSLEHFSHAFSRYVQISPSVFRKNKR